MTRYRMKVPMSHLLMVQWGLGISLAGAVNERSHTVVSPGGLLSIAF